MQLPDPKTFLATSKPEPEIGVSAEFQRLLIQYCASMPAAELDAVDWLPLSRKLHTQAEHLAEAAAYCESQSGGKFWQEVMHERIKRANDSKLFRDIGWERLEARAVSRLVQMEAQGMIRDPGELLAIASHARRANGGSPGTGSNPSVNINIGAGGSDMGFSTNGLPDAGHTMTIELSHRMAESLRRHKPDIAPIGERVIDGKMLSAAELRGALQAKVESNSEQGESE